MSKWSPTLDVEPKTTTVKLIESGIIHVMSKHIDESEQGLTCIRESLTVLEKSLGIELKAKVKDDPNEPMPANPPEFIILKKRLEWMNEGVSDLSGRLSIILDTLGLRY